jgi:NADH dehydrogenase FAD-containing subunit
LQFHFHHPSPPQAVVVRIRDAKSIAVVGGGAAGVEAAAEVAEAFPGKAITLVHPGKRLLPTLPPKAGALAESWLEAHKVEVSGAVGGRRDEGFGGVR